MPDPSRNCSRCGARLPVDAPRGLCPRCLAAVNLATETAFAGDEAAGAQAPPSLEELAPHFPQLEILEYLGRGGMGVVYKARQKSLQRIIALKLLAPERVQDSKFAERFAHEARALARLNHPSIVTIYDFGQAGGFFYLLMEFVDGVNLRQALQKGRFTPEQALAIVPPVCEALQYAHEHGIVHRDIKPENLLLDRAGRVKIADFGIAKMLDAEGSNVGLAESQPAGTPQYMAPEQMAHRGADHRADIYSLGVVLYELLTGELPTGKFQPPSRKVQIDVRLDEVVLRALQETPELRFQTASEMGRLTATIATQSQSAAPARERDSNPGQPKWPLWLAAVLTAPFVIFGLLVLVWLTANRDFTEQRHEIVRVFTLWLGLLALALPFLIWKFSRRDHETGKRPAFLRIVFFTLLTTLLAVIAGRIITRSYQSPTPPATVATDSRTGSETTWRVDQTTVSPADRTATDTVSLQAPFLVPPEKLAGASLEQKAVARIKLKEAGAELERVAALHNDNLVSQHELDQARLGVELAEAELTGDSQQVNRVHLKQAQEEFRRVAALHDNKNVSEHEFNKARLGVERAEAELAGDPVQVSRVEVRLAQEDFRRASELREQKLISESEFNKKKFALELAEEKLERTASSARKP